LAKKWRPDLTAAPVFPSLIEEGKSGGGYDVKLERRGIPIFLQFKLSDYMVRSTATEVQQGILTVPFFRVHLRPSRHSDQHELLGDLEAAGNIVRYVAPLFHTTAEFNQAYLSDEVLRRSIFLRPSAIGPLPDGNNHHVAFQTRKSWWFLSDPRRGDVTLDDEAFDGDVRHAINDRGATALTPVALQELLGKMAQIVDERSRERRRVNRSSLDLPAFD